MPQIPANPNFENFPNLLGTQESRRESTFDIRYYVELMLRYRWFIITAFCIAMIAGIILAVNLPRMYEAQTLIFTESQRVPNDYVTSIVSSNLDERVNNLVQMIKSRTSLINIIEKFELFSEPKFENLLLDEKIKEMHRRTSIVNIFDKKSRRPSDMFAISFEGEDPEKVMYVVNAMATLVIDQNLKARELQALETTYFLDDELGKIRKRLEEVEMALKEYRKDHMGELPEQLEGNISILDRLQQQVVEKQQSLRDEKNRLIFIENQLKVARSQAYGGGATGGEPTINEELKQQLADLQTRYTDRHPDMIRLKKQIEESERQNIHTASEQGDQRRVVLLRRVSRPNSSSAIEAELVLQRNGVIREIAAIKDEISQLQTQVGFYQQRVENTPKQEQELLTLKRDYENIKETYNSLLQRKLEADIAVNMEKDRQGEQFRILEPARMPVMPKSPNMKKLFMMCVLAGLFFGGGLIVLSETLDDAVRKPESVHDRLGIPVLIAMPTLEQRKNVILRRANNISSILGVMISLTLFACFAAVTIFNLQQPMGLIKKFLNLA